MNALLLTGASISLYGSSRPISGAEHHMSHYWEAYADQHGKSFAMHGEQVAVGTVLALMMVEELRQKKVDFNLARDRAAQYDSQIWEAEICRAYGNAADTIIEQEKVAGKNDMAGRLKRIDIMEEKWADILDLLSGADPSQTLRTLLKDIGCPCDPKDIGISAELLKDTFLYCKETRARYTVYQMAWDLGLLDELSDIIINKLKQRDRV